VERTTHERLNRRRFLATAAGGGIAAVGLGSTSPSVAATDDDYAFANFGLPAEWLLQEIHARTLAAKLGTKAQLRASRLARSFAGQHAEALASLLTNAAQTVPTREDFDFQLPEDVFSSRTKADELARTVTAAVRGAYQGAAAASSDASYRTLFASLAAGHAGELVALGATPEPFPVAVDLEKASTAIEEYLG